MTIDEAKELVAGLQPLLLASFLFRDGVAQATAAVAGGSVSSISVDVGGADYLAPPSVFIYGDGSGATAEATITDGVVTSIAVTEGGTGYTYAVIAFGDVLLLSTKDVTYSGQHYQGRLDTIDLEAVQMMSESGVDVPPSLTLHIADADASIFLNWEEGVGRGFKGAKVTLTLVFYDVLAGTFSSDSMVRYIGICDPATPTDETTLEVRTTNRLNAGRKQLPTELIQLHCWKIRPYTAAQCAQADDPASPYYPCGITDPGKPDCFYTRDGCLAADNLARFAGVTFAPPKDGGKGEEYTSGQWVQLYNSSNDAKYGNPWPVVLGRGWVECPVLNVRQDGNYARMDVGLTVGHIDSSLESTVAMKVVVNGYEFPPAGYDSDTGFHALNPGNVGWWNWKSRGWRDGNAAADTDPYGSEAVIECVVPRTVAGGESVPQVSVLFTGPAPGAQFQGAAAPTLSHRIAGVTVVGGLVTVTFVGINNDVASNDPLYEVTIADNTYGAINGTWPHLINWTWGPPGTVQFNAAVADGSGTGGTLTYPSVTGSAAVYDNPAWHLYDLLLRAGWKPEEIDYASFVIAANTCVEPVEYSSTFGDTAFHARYKSDIILRQRRPASEIIRGVRNNFAALLQPNRDSGRLSVLLKGSLAAQQPAAQPGSNYNDAIASVLRDGSSANGFVAYHFTEDNTISIRGIGRPISDTPNRLAFQFQDSENNFAPTSLALVESEDVERVGQELPSTVQIEGCATTDQATRLTKMMNLEAHRGNPVGDTRGTRWYTISTSIRAIRVGLGQIAMITWPKLGLDAQLARVMGVKGPAKNGVITLTVAIHADEWYVDSLLQSDATGYSNPKRDKLARASFPACPDIVAPRTGDPFLDVTDKTFALVPVYDVSTDGTVLAKMRLRSKIAVNEFGAAHPPQIATQTSVANTGGTLKSGLYYIAIVARDGNGKLSPPSLIASAHMPVGVTTGSIPVVVQWWHPDTAGYEVFAGRTAFMLTHQATGSGTPDTITLASFKVRSWGCPDQELDALVAVGKVVRHSGITGTQLVLEVAADTLTISGDWSGVDLADYEVSLVAKLDNSELPVFNYTISANATTSAGLTELTVSPDPVTDGLAVGDVIVIRSKPTLSDGGRTWTDPAWMNPLENSGGGLAPSEEVGMIGRIIYGTGAGLTNIVASATTTSHTMARAWAVTPDSTSRMIIEEPAWLPLNAPIRPLSNSDPTQVLALTFPVENYSRRTMLVGLTTEDGSEHRAVEALMPVREVYVFGAPETTVTLTAADSPYDQKWSDMNLLVDTTDGEVIVNLLSQKLFPGRPVVGKKISDDANIGLFVPAAGELIDGQSSWALQDQWESLHIKSNV